MLNIAFFAATTLSVDALQIVYPKSSSVEIAAESTFFIGSTEPGAKLTINDREIKIFEDGSFVEVVPLSEGVNNFEINSSNENQNDKVSYIIKKIPKPVNPAEDAELIEFPENEYIYSTVVKNNVPLREKPDEDANRITHLGVDTVLMIDAKQGDFCRVVLSATERAWVRADYIVNYSIINEKMLASAQETTITEDELFDYIKTPLTFPVPFKVTENETGLTVDLYSIKENASDTKVFETKNNFKNLTLNSVNSENLSTYFVELKEKLWGYDAYYEKNTFVLKIRKPPLIDVEKPFKNIVIALDAGHGGEDAGAIGPTGVKEKDINFDVAEKLKKILEDNGATVVMTRTTDHNVNLYERVKIAKSENALFLLSLHANALPDGANPYEKHGTSVFYYNKESLQLAKTLRDTLTKELETKDDGVSKCSFVLTRPTAPLSVLIEIAYMIHPQEYSLLLNEDFRTKAAESIKNGLIQYLNLQKDN